MLGISRTPGYLGFDATSMLANLNTEFEKNELAMSLVNVQKSILSSVLWGLLSQAA